MQKVAAVLLLCAAGAHGHGWVSDPPSRAENCRVGVDKNTGCGPIKYEPSSLEGKDGWPGSGGPADGDLAAGGTANNRFPELNEQSATRWHKVPVSAGVRSFTWRFLAPHLTADYKYYMTKQDWDVNAPVGRDSFDLTPFCVIDAKKSTPPTTLTHECTIPARTGYQIILAAWDVGDTSNTFYNVIDVVMDGAGGGNPSPPTPPGPVPATPVPVSRCTGSTINKYGSCLSSPDCCEAGTQCFEQSKWYAQCLTSCSGAGWTCRVLG
eukprot:TRINITY_DN1231_c0_g1_i10.p2 TRINITY_DN1231_c0_g1~~TRINITY_DN1231_c0_g1_i10.p2  ORF type:complete len:266 (+),score=84.34 TRINITY_DN1231_c0_g1_i10:101-898(+)